MTIWKITSGEPLQGRIRPPSSKSQTLRAFLFAALSKQGGIIHHPLESQDALAMKQACSLLGAQFEDSGESCLVRPLALESNLERCLCFNAQNSGIVWRFLTGILSTRESLSLVWGDDSILNRRPMWPLAKALSQVGVQIWQTQERQGPCLVRGGWKCWPSSIEIEGFDSQPVSAMLIASALQENKEIHLKVKKPKEVQWAHLTVDWLRRLGTEIKTEASGENYWIKTGPRWKRMDYTVPVDYSSAAFLLAAALVSKGHVEIQGLVEDPQPDKALLSILEAAGADLRQTGQRTLVVNGQKAFEGFDVDISGPIDLLPILLTLSCYAGSESVIRGISGARIKESDRVDAMVGELSKMGAHIRVNEDEVRITPSLLRANRNLQSHQDHRIAMALAVAALGADGESLIHDTQWAAKTYPGFAEDLSSLGAQVVKSSV
jgi:3-phosphoshikimate 1-carboxyvinyltransferase